MKLTTPVPIAPLPDQIDHNSSILMLGSCFTENMGKKLAYYGFDVAVNPFGIIFNPHSLRVLMERAVHNIPFTKEDTAGHFSYLTHSDLNDHDPQDLLAGLNYARELLIQRLKAATHIFVTLGTAWVYRHVESDHIVANCHKQPQRLFHKELLSTDQLHEELSSMIQLIKLVNKRAAITFTLSPVRHIKDGIVENQRSKSRLHEVIHSQVDLGTAAYFPAYEIAMDELRDYRFYARDMVHLNELGIDFIWSRFRESGINNNTLNAQKAIEKYRRLQQHRPHDIAAHKLQIQQMKEYLQMEFPKLQL